MAKKKTKFCCKACGYESPKWMGRCPGCQEWNTMEEASYFEGKAAEGAKTIIKDGNRKAKYLKEIKEENFEGLKTDIEELDRVLGGSLINGSLILLSAPPGTGKSTLLLGLSQNIGEKYGKVAYFSGEESEYQTKVRADRLGVSTENLLVLHTKDIEVVEEVVERENPKLIIIDSIQTLGDPTVKSEPGSPSQVKNCTGRLVNIAKGKGITTFVVGQVNKDAEIAGPKILEHMVDTVLYLEGEKYSDLRLLRAKKNRFGSANELGVFQMEEKGLVEIKNPSEYLLANRQNDESGSSVVCISDTRPLLVEIQALVSKPVVENAIPRRTSEGFSRNRLNIIAAVLEKKCRIPLAWQDIYINIVGGMEVEEPGADLGVAMAMVSSEKNKPIDPYTVLIGEIGLTGEVRPVANAEQLVNEAEKVGFKTCILPSKNYGKVSEKKPKIALKSIDTVKDAINLLF